MGKAEYVLLWRRCERETRAFDYSLERLSVWWFQSADSDWEEICQAQNQTHAQVVGLGLIFAACVLTFACFLCYLRRKRWSGDVRLNSEVPRSSTAYTTACFTKVLPKRIETLSVFKSWKNMFVCFRYIARRKFLDVKTHSWDLTFLVSAFIDSFSIWLVRSHTTNKI